jgi:hypothetical protein
MERSAIRGLCIRVDGIPDYASLHPGYKSLRFPTGKTYKKQVNPLKQKYSTLPKFGFGVVMRHLIPVRGAYRDRHDMRGGLRWTLVTSAR